MPAEKFASETVTKPIVEGVGAGQVSAVKAGAGLGELSASPLFSREIHKNTPVALTRSRSDNRGGCTALGHGGRCWDESGKCCVAVHVFAEAREQQMQEVL